MSGSARTGRVPRFGALAGAALLAASCGPPAIHDVDLRPVRSPLLLASVPELGWLAVDSTGGGYRAVLELHVEAPMGVSDYLALHVPRLACDAEGFHDPVRVRREPPVCWPADVNECGAGADPSRCPPPSGAEEVHCIHVIRAEYAFRSLPRPRDEIRLTFGQEATKALWAHP